MAGFFDKFRTDPAVVWTQQATPDRQGREIFDAGIEILVRWDDKTEKFTDSKGATQYSNATVMVGEVYQIDDKLYNGTLASLSAGEIADPASLTTAHPIRKLLGTPVIKGATAGTFRRVLL